jgi:hypothetical protein
LKGAYPLQTTPTFRNFLEIPKCRVKAQIKRLYEQVHPSGNIETIPGVGENLGPTLVGIIANPARFHSGVKLRGYSGFCPRQDDSGEGSKKGLPATKEGPSRFRWVTYLAAGIGRQWDPQPAKTYYEQMVYKGKCHTQAVCAVGTHLVDRILLSSREIVLISSEMQRGGPPPRRRLKSYHGEQQIVYFQVSFRPNPETSSGQAP